jgi:hypothetical protein
MKKLLVIVFLLALTGFGRAQEKADPRLADLAAQKEAADRDFKMGELMKQNAAYRYKEIVAQEKAILEGKAGKPPPAKSK